MPRFIVFLDQNRWGTRGNGRGGEQICWQGTTLGQHVLRGWHNVTLELEVFALSVALTGIVLFSCCGC